MSSTATAFKIVIPARYGSQRLPGKPLLKFAGKTMLEHVFLRAQQSATAEVVIATDDKRIATVAETFASNVVMTSPDHPSGTDRIAEVADHYGWSDDDVVVNLQGDEPLMPPSLLNQVAENLLNNSQASIATLCAPISNSDDLNDPSKVKVVFDKSGMALLFSRSAIPYNQDAANNFQPGSVFRHIGLYAYKVSFLKAYKNLPASELEKTEKLEQLRALWHGFKIHVDQAVELPGQDVNTMNDVSVVDGVLKSSGK